MTDLRALAQRCIDAPGRDAIEHWGALMRLARKASSLATEEQREAKRISDPLESSILLYTDDPTTAAIFGTCSDMAAICKTSAIEGVCIVMGENFPPDSHEAPRDDPEMPRVAAMYFTAPGEKCPRCRNFTRKPELEVCAICAAALIARSETA